MLFWFRRRREAVRLAEADAATLIAEDPLSAYSEARRRQHDAHNAETSNHWGRVARATARRTGKGVGLDTATRMAEDADFGVLREPATPPPEPKAKRSPCDPQQEVDPIAELERILGDGK